MPSVAVDFTSDPPNRARKAWAFLSIVVLLRLLCYELPKNVAYIGMWGFIDGEQQFSSWITRTSGFVLLLAATHLFLRFALNRRSWLGLLEGWPRGAYRLIPWNRVASMIVIGLCLAKFDQSWLALAFLVLLLEFLREARRGPRNRQYLKALGEVLWDTRLCWLTIVVAQACLGSGSQSVQLEASLSVCILVVALTTQLYPRLSFAFCFFKSDATAQVVFERSLWFMRIERLVLATLLAFHCTEITVIKNLALYGIGRCLFLMGMRTVKKNTLWSEVLQSERGPYCYASRMVLPDWHSVEQKRETALEVNVPVDRFGDGPLSRPLTPSVVKTSPLAGKLPCEALLAILLFLLALVQWVPPDVLPSEQQRRLTYQTRAATVGNEVYLFKSVNEPGADRLLDTLGHPSVQVHTGPENAILTGLLCLTILLGLFARWRSPLLGMWGFSVGSPKDEMPLVSLSIIATITLASWLGWVWFPTTPGALVFAMLLWQRPLPLLSQLTDATCKPIQDARNLFRYPEPGSSKRPSVCEPLPTPKIPQLEIRVGRGLISLADPRDGSLLLGSMPKLRAQFRESAGFELPPILVADLITLKPDTYLVRYGDVVIFDGRTGIPSLPHSPHPESWPLIVESMLCQILPALLDDAPLFLNDSTVEKILNAATGRNRALVHFVRNIHSRRTIRKTVKAVLAAGFSLREPARWLRALYKVRGSEERVLQQVLTNLKSQHPRLKPVINGRNDS